MARRMLWMLTVVAVVIASLGFVKYRQIEAATKKFASFQPPPTAVTALTWILRMYEFRMVGWNRSTMFFRVQFPAASLKLSTMK